LFRGKGDRAGGDVEAASIKATAEKTEQQQK
jgi:hypothetical protein